jgi:hypothetical protein
LTTTVISAADRSPAIIEHHMRIIFPLTLAACVTEAAWGQQPVPKPSVQNLLAKLHSQNDQERLQAFEALRSDPGNLKNPQVRSELIDLFDRENSYLDSQLEEAQKKGYSRRRRS